jgi:hypothetical protein
MFDVVASNLGMSIESIILLLVLLTGLIAYARGFQVGIITHFVMLAATFIWFYSAGLQYGIVLICMLMTLVILCLSIYSMAKTAPSGGFV